MSQTNIPSSFTTKRLLPLPMGSLLATRMSSMTRAQWPVYLARAALSTRTPCPKKMPVLPAPPSIQPEIGTAITRRSMLCSALGTSLALPAAAPAQLQPAPLPVNRPPHLAQLLFLLLPLLQVELFRFLLLLLPLLLLSPRTMEEVSLQAEKSLQEWYLGCLCSLGWQQWLATSSTRSAMRTKAKQE